MGVYDKPPGPFNWATDTPLVSRVDPGAAKRGIGWVSPEKPPDTFFNQLFGESGDFFLWLDERMGDGANNDIFELWNPGTTSPYLRYDGTASLLELIYTGSGLPFMDHVGLTTRLLDIQGIPDNPWLEYVGSPQRITFSSPTSGPGTNRHLEFLGTGDTTFYDSTTDTAWFSYTAGTGVAFFPGDVDVDGDLVTLNILSGGLPGAVDIGAFGSHFGDLFTSRVTLSSGAINPVNSVHELTRQAAPVCMVTMTSTGTHNVNLGVPNWNVASTQRNSLGVYQVNYTTNKANNGGMGFGNSITNTVSVSVNAASFTDRHLIGCRLVSTGALFDAANSTVVYAL